MKTLKIFIALLIISIGGANAQAAKAELQVSGLTCALCSKATEQSLKTLPFIADIKTDLQHNIFLITFKPDRPIKLDLIGKKVQDAGFFVNSLKLTLNFDNISLTNGVFSYSGDVFQIVNTVNKSLKGDVAFTVVDKGFAPKAVSKKYLDQLTATPAAAAGRVFHVVI